MTRAYKLARKPAFISSVGVAAAISLVVGFFQLPQGAARVDAAIILERLSEQIKAPKLLEITLDSLSVEEAFLNGTLQVSPDGVAGDLEITVQEGGGKIELDIALGITREDGWILVRKLVVPDPQAMAMLNFFLPAGTETLIRLPSEELGLDIAKELGQLGQLDDLEMDKISEVVQELIDSSDEVGATVRRQRDGTVRLTLPIKDAGTLRALGHLKVFQDLLEEEGEDIDIDAEIEDGDGEELYGSTIEVVYDPKKQLVRSISIEDIGEMKGRITISLDDGEIDPDLLDSSRVTNDNTRVLDLGALMGTIKDLGALMGTIKSFQDKD